MKILVLVDMQNDFLLPEGKLWIGHDTSKFIDRVQKAAQNFCSDPKDLIYGLLDTHHISDSKNCHIKDLFTSCEFEQWPEHCIEGTWGHEAIKDLYKDVKCCFQKNGFVSYSLLDELIKNRYLEIHFAGVLASICVQENIAAFYNYCKQHFNFLPTIVVDPMLVDDLTLDAKDSAIKRMKEIYNVKIIG